MSGAPKFEERMASLVYAHQHGFKTSVSVEPMLDSKNIVHLFQVLKPHVTDSIWIGKLNHIRQRVVIETAEDEQQVDIIENDKLTREFVRFMSS